MSSEQDTLIVSSAWLPRRTLLGGIGALLGDALLAACSGNTGAQLPTSPPPSPTASGPIVSTSVNVPSNGPLSSLVSATPTTPAPSSPAGAMVKITNAANGTTINLAVGTQALLALDTNHDWMATVEDPTVLMPVVGAAVPVGAQALYVARTPGQTTLTAVGEPLCRKAQPPCGAPTIMFRALIVVA